MGLIRDKIESGPRACGAQKPWKWEADLLFRFDAERSGKTHIYSRKVGESARDRMEVLKSLHGADGVDHDKVNVWIDFLVFGSECIDLNKQGLPLTPALLEDKAVLLAAAEQYSDVITADEVEAVSVASKWE